MDEEDSLNLIDVMKDIAGSLENGSCSVGGNDIRDALDSALMVPTVKLMTAIIYSAEGSDGDISRSIKIAEQLCGHVDRKI